MYSNVNLQDIGVPQVTSGGLHLLPAPATWLFLRESMAKKASAGIQDLTIWLDAAASRKERPARLPVKLWRRAAIGALCARQGSTSLPAQ